MITVTKQVVFTRSVRGRKRLADKPALSNVAVRLFLSTGYCRPTFEWL